VDQYSMRFFLIILKMNNDILVIFLSIFNQSLLLLLDLKIV